MVFIFDISFILIVMFVLGLGSIATIAQWVLEHIFLVGLVICGKSLLFFGRCLFVKGKGALHIFLGVVFIILDIVRNGYLFACIVRMLESMFADGLIGLILGIIDIIFGGLLLLLAAMGPMYFVYDGIFESWEGSSNSDFLMCIIPEIVAIIALIVVSLWVF